MVLLADLGNPTTTAAWGWAGEGDVGMGRWPSDIPIDVLDSILHFKIRSVDLLMVGLDGIQLTSSTKDI